MKTLWRIQVLISIALAGAMLMGCRRPDESGHDHAKSKRLLFSVCMLVYGAESLTGEPVPIELSELISWVQEHASADEPYIDYKNRTIVDTWGSRVVVISEDHKFLGLGSPGPNRKWEGGSGDDIVVMLDDVKK